MKPRDIVIETIKDLHSQYPKVYVSDVLKAIPETTLSAITVTETLHSLRVAKQITISNGGIITWIIGEI